MIAKNLIPLGWPLQPSNGSSSHSRNAQEDGDILHSNRARGDKEGYHLAGGSGGAMD